MASRIVRWFLEISLDAETLRWWSGHGSVVFDGETWTGLGQRWRAPKSLKRTAGLKSEKFDLEFDSSRQTNNADPIGHLLDQKWRRRQMRLRRIAWAAGAGPDVGDVLADERGRIRNLSDELQAGKPATLSMEIESGMLAYLERRMETRSPAGQKRVFPGDLGFDLIAKLEGKTIPWRTKETKAGKVEIGFQDGYDPVPRKLPLGRFVDDGSFVADFTNGQQKKYWQRVRAIADCRINKLDKIWVNGELVRDAPLVHGVRTLLRIKNDKGEDRCWATFYDGRPDQVADAYLVAAEPLWTVNHRLQGVAYVIMEHLWDDDISQSFDYRFGGEGALLYDRRLDSTAGGAGTQRWDDPGTWVYSANAKVAADHYRSGIRIMAGSSAMWFGVGEASDAVPYAEFAMLADHCDDNVDLKAGGTQKRYEVNGLLAADQSHEKNLQRLADQMAARVIDQGGRIAFRPPLVRTPVVTITDNDLVRGSKSRIDPGGRIDDMVNKIEGRFVNPAADWKRDDFPAVTVEAYVDDDNGEIADSLDLELETSSERAQRIAKLKIEDSRRILEQEESYKPEVARLLAPGEWFLRQSDLRGFPDGKMFIMEEADRQIDGSADVKASEVFPDELVWVKETATDLVDPPGVPDVDRPDITPPDIIVTPGDVTDGDGTVSFPGVGVFINYDANALGVRTEIEIWRDDGTGEPDLAYPPITRSIGVGQTLLQVAGEIMPGVDYVLRARAVIEGIYGSWSAWHAFTASSDFIVPAGLTDLTGLVDIAAFAAGIEPVAIAPTSLPNPSGYVGPSVVFLVPESKLYRYTGSGWTAQVIAADVAGQLTNAQIADLAAAKLTGQIAGTQVTDGAISTPKLSAGSVTTAKIAANAVTASQVAAGAITAGKIAAGVVTATEIAAGAITAGKISAGAVSATELAAGAVSADKLAANSVVAGKIAAGAVSASSITVANLGAISANLGTITAGALSINNKFIVDAAGNVTIRNATTGQRLVISNSTLEVYDSSNVRRVRLGIW